MINVQYISQDIGALQRTHKAVFTIPGRLVTGEQCILEAHITDAQSELSCEVTYLTTKCR